MSILLLCLILFFTSRIYREPLITRSPHILDPSPTVTTQESTHNNDSLETTNTTHESQETDYEDDNVVEEAHPPPIFPVNVHPMVTREKNNIQKPNKKYANNVMLAEVEPTSHVQAMKDERWRNAMGGKFDSILRNGTFTLVGNR